MTGDSRPALGVVFAGGGTGGHLFPGVAVAREVLRRRPEARVFFVGAGRGIENRVLAREGFRLERVRSLGLMGKSLGAIGRAAALAPVTIVDALTVLRRTRPDVVVGLGGYSAGPVVLLAALGGRPTMLMEQNAVPGITNRLLAPVVRAAAVSYDAAAAYFGAKAFVAGNPVRDAFFDPAPPSGEGLRVLVLGGSQGAHTLNEALVGAAPALAAAEPRLVLTHQTGERDVEAVRDGYRAAGVTARVEPFLDTVADDMRLADAVVCRAGATTLAEVAASGRPALIVPLPRAANDHQRRNAAVFADAGAADVVEEAALQADLAPRLLALLGDAGRRSAMAGAARGLARPDAARRVVDRIERLAGLVPAGGNGG
ncbi:MAG: undecaprenyldiphospho-muramoylpentapeptide beta-N-acetylglucosaminyltransferase [Acidobacteria bacterium]|nr:undecaprenyldiphospho-muramoylpentapeptide beta-N-acetylglucosaminyltransferase [Acidobacteriota bacterium]